MRNRSCTFTTLSLALLILLTSGCGKSKNNPIAAFEPEVINTADAFQFQITAASDVTTVLNYTWTNSAAQATIDHSTVTSNGSASVTLLDADGTQVYSGSLSASASEQSSAGIAGSWTVRVTLVNFDGTVNFAVQPL